MSRSSKKGPFVEARLMGRIEAMNEKNEKRMIRTWSRTSTVFPDMVGHTGVIPAVVRAVEATDAVLGETVAAVAALIGVIESMFAKLRLFRVTDLLGVAFILALLGVLFFYILQG